MHLAECPPGAFLDCPVMKIFAATVLILMLAVTTVPAGASADPALDRAGGENKATILPVSESGLATELDATQPVASALDLSLFGIISLGVIGLFWIRRHTSEL